MKVRVQMKGKYEDDTPLALRLALTLTLLVYLLLGFVLLLLLERFIRSVYLDTCVHVCVCLPQVVNVTRALKQHGWEHA